MYVMVVRHPNRIKIAENLGSWERSPWKLLNSQSRRHTRMKSQKRDAFQKRIMLSAAKTQNEDRKIYIEFGSMSHS